METLGFVDRRKKRINSVKDRQKLMLSDLFIVVTDDVETAYHWLMKQSWIFGIEMEDLIRRTRTTQLSKEQTEKLEELLRESALRYQEHVSEDAHVVCLRERVI